MVLDTAMLSLAGSFLLWLLLVLPALRTDLSGFELSLVVATWVGFVAVLATTARMFLVWRTNPALALLASGVAVFLAADFIYGRALLAGTWTTGTPVDLGFLGVIVLTGAAALMPSMGRLASAPYARHQMGPVRLVMVALALLLAPTVLLAEASAGQVTTVTATALVSGAVGVLVLGRLTLSVRAYQRRVGREQAVREGSRASVLAATESDVLAGVQQAFRALLPAGSAGQARLVDADGLATEPAEPSPVDIAGHGGVIGELALPVADRVPTAGRLEPTAPQRLLVFRAPITDLIELHVILRALADQALSALQRIELTDRIHAEDRERYFRTLVLTSDDVTVISRDGRVVYATPSARSMFGRDITGERTDDLTLAHPPQLRSGTTGTDEDPAAHTDSVDRFVHRDDRIVETRVRTRDLTGDLSVGGIVTTLRDVTFERRLQRDLAFRASHDQLTGLANATLFHDQLYAHSDRRRQDPQPEGVAALFIDLDNFKGVNDSHGHHVGDQLLAEVAHRITTSLRRNDLAARIGGDEFAVFLREVAGADDATAIAQRIVETVAQPMQIGPVTLACSVSIGVAFTDRPEHPDALLRQADTALYRVKASGKAGWRLYQEAEPDPTPR
jgi:diguanylate cyclase (GGDEF)-like protein